MTTYTVIALYEDTLQRFAESYQAKSPAAAEDQAHSAAKKEGASLLVAAVIEGVPDIVA